MKKIIGILIAVFVITSLNSLKASSYSGTHQQSYENDGFNKSYPDKDIETFNIVVSATQLVDTVNALRNAGWTITEITKHPTDNTYTIKGQREIPTDKNLKNIVHDGVYRYESDGHVYISIIKDGWCISSTIDGKEWLTKPERVLLDSYYSHEHSKK